MELAIFRLCVAMESWRSVCICMFFSEYRTGGLSLVLSLLARGPSFERSWRFYCSMQLAVLLWNVADDLFIECSWRSFSCVQLAVLLLNVAGGLAACSMQLAVLLCNVADRLFIECSWWSFSCGQLVVLLNVAAGLSLQYNLRSYCSMQLMVFLLNCSWRSFSFV